MIRLLLCSLPLVACVGAEDDLRGPFTGETRRFVVDSIRVPRNNTEARELGGDLNGDDTVDNQLGMVISTLANMGNVTMAGDEIIAAGAISSTVEITADSFANDGSVSVTLFGIAGEGARATAGTITDGVYETKITGTTTLHLPVFIHADPSRVPAIGLRIKLTPDGAGGYDANVHAAVPHPIAPEMAFTASAQMIEQYPTVHIGYLSLFDTPPKDWVLQHDEFTKNSLIVSLMAPDVQIGNTDALSLGIHMHLSPCAEGSCVTATATCDDRVKNGTETDVDCGGDCRGCVEGSACSEAGDCETASCTAGVCDPASCSNGVRDSFETDVDCGAFCGVPCAYGERCYNSTDCLAPAACSGEYGVCN